MTAHLRPLDLAIVAAYLIGITLFGLRFRKKSGGDRSLRSYFLADNTIPWWAIALSIVSAETSTLTVISIPGVAFGGNFGFLQIVLGYMLGRIVVAGLFLPRYFSGNMMTAYQLIDQRFGSVLHKVTAGLFLLTRAAAEGVRVFAVSIVVGIAIGTRDVLSIAIISALTLLYTFEGGMAAVIWTDVVQMAIYIGGTLVAIWSLGHHIGADRSAIAGWHTIHQVAGAAGKFHMFNFALNLTTTYTFWAGILGGTFLTMASHGTDQLMVQRMLAARNLRESRLALLSSGVVIFIQFALFLLIGAGLYVFAQQGVGVATTPGAPFMAGPYPGMSGIPTTSWIHGLAPDRIFPTFIVREMPLGIAGLLIAAILAAAMSNLSAALNSLSSTTVVDFYTRLRPTADDRERGIISKSSTVLWALVLFAIAVYSLSVGGKGHVVEIGLSIASVAYGCLLGVFLLGTLTKFATQTGATIGMLCGFALNLWLWQGTFPVQIGHQPGGHWTNLGGYPINVTPAFIGITIPHIAFTWYVLIGALVTFAIGSLFSLIFRKQSRRQITAAISLLALFCLSSPKGTCMSPAQPQRATTAALTLPLPFCLSSPKGTCMSPAAPHQSAPSTAPPSKPYPLNPAPSLDFTPITTLLNDAIAAHKLPGAVVLIGHDGKVVFEHAYGDRKLAGEPGLNGKPSPAEPMTEDTVFDMASLTKCLATATAIMQLYEQGKITSFDDPVEKYLPEFATSSAAPSASTAGVASAPSANGASPSQPGAKPQVSAREKSQRAEGPTQNAATFDKSKVTLRMLLSHTSGEGPDVDLRDPWGLAAPDKAEGIHRALITPLKAAPGSVMTYSDINFILLGAIVEKLSGQREDFFAQEHIFKPLGMKQTGFHPFYSTCNRRDLAAEAHGAVPLDSSSCISQSLPSSFVRNLNEIRDVAPTAHDNEGTATTNPDFDHLLRGTVHDPTTRRMGGVAGHAGVFSTAHDISLFAQALLDKLTKDTGPFPLKQSTLQLMTTPEQPSTTGSTSFNSDLFTASQLRAANQAQAYAVADGAKPAAPGLAPAYPAMKGVNLRGFGWDIDTAFSKPRGAIFPIGSFGHTGFTGTSLWMDPASNTYVILLANAIHPRGNPPISNLRGQLATLAAQALGMGGDIPPVYDGTQKPDPLHRRLSPGSEAARKEAVKAELKGEYKKWLDQDVRGPLCQDPTPNTIQTTSGWGCAPNTLTGIDILEYTHFAPLANLHHLALFTNQSGIDAHGTRTIDVLVTSHFPLVTLFSPEHGLATTLDTEHIANSTDAATHLPIISLYGSKDADRRPTHAQLKDLDAVLIDLQDAGVHFWTYEAAMTYFLDAAATEQTQYHHPLEIILLDRPNLVGGKAVQGPVSDPGSESYVNPMPLPVRHGLTLGELAKYYVVTHHLATHLTVIPMQHWSSTQYFADTGLPWVNPSPNLRSPEAAILYPALGLIEYANISVGRGTGHPFSFFGAPWLNATDVTAALSSRNIPGVTFTAITEPIAEDSNHYPFHGQTIPAVHVTVTDRDVLDTPELGIEILAVLHRLYPKDFHLAKVKGLLCNQATLDALERGDDPRAIAATWTTALDQFKAATAPYRLYP